MDKPKIYTLKFNEVYPLYVKKIERKGRTIEELNTIISWLTSYDTQMIEMLITQDITFETFFNKAPKINEKASLVKGVICGIRVETIEDEMTKNIRILDKLVDELAKGKDMNRIILI